jgi:hypothetical protein
MQMRTVVAACPVIPVIADGNPAVWLVELMVAKLMFEVEVKYAGFDVLPDVV